MAEHHQHHRDGDDDTHASASRWRHQESSSFAKHAAPRAPAGRHDSHDLTTFLNSTRVDGTPQSTGTGGPKYTPIAVTGDGDGAQSAQGPATMHDDDLVRTEIPSNGQGVLEVYVPFPPISFLSPRRIQKQC